MSHQKSDNIEQKPGSNQPQAPRSKSVESVDDASAQKPLCNPRDCGPHGLTKGALN